MMAERNQGAADQEQLEETQQAIHPTSLQSTAHFAQLNSSTEAGQDTPGGVVQAQTISGPTTIASTQVGQEFGDYELLSEIARGGMGVVFRARQKKVNRIVALKMILSGRFAGTEEIQRFYSEAESAAKLDHPNIVPIFDVGKQGDHHFFSMGFVEGESLSARIHQGPMTCKKAATLGAMISRAVAYAHSQGVIHRDLKPANILLSTDDTPRVTDFGLAKQVGSNKDLTATGQVMGTPGYMPPEQAAGFTADVGETADVYALGAILYACVTGRPPFQSASPIETIRQVIHVDPVAPRTLNPEIDKDFETICLKCLEKEPSKRYESAVVLAEELERFLTGAPIHARPVGSIERGWRWCKRNRTVAGLATGVFVSLILGTAISVYFALLAEKRAQRAQQGTQIALATLETVVNTVQDKLRDIPGAREVRQNLLRSALADLQKVSGEVQSQSQVDYNTATVLVDLGLLFEEIGDDDGNAMTETAEQHFLKAIDIFRQLKGQASTPPSWSVDYSRALDQLGNFYLELDRVEDADPYITEALALRRVIAGESPDDPSHQLKLASTICNHGDSFAMRGNLKESLPVYQEAVAISRPLAASDPGNMVNKARLAECLMKAGDACHDMDDHDSAIEYFRECLDVCQARYDYDPRSSYSQDALSYAHERMGNHFLKVSDPRQAREHYLEMLRLTQLAHEQDPRSLFLIDGLSVCYEKIAKVSSQLGDKEAAAEANKKAAEYQGRLTDTSR